MYNNVFNLRIVQSKIAIFVAYSRKRRNLQNSANPFAEKDILKNSKLHSIFTLIAGILCVLAVLSGCKKDDYDTSPGYKLDFSTDSVKFDTVFTTVGSATQVLKVYNRENSYVNIQHVRLLNDANNSYRINVDGVPGDAHTHVEIGPKDSIYIFIEVTVNPNENELYPYVEGKIEFEINGNTQAVKLVSWGWDAIFYTPTVFPTNGLPDYTVISDDPNATVTWTAEKPIVIYGYLVVDSLQSLVIQPGARVFFHQGSGLWIYRDGNIKALGTLEEPIVFQGDRLESFYAEQPGQWDRIWINEGSQNNVFEYVLIKNNFIGIQTEPLPFNNPTPPDVSTNTLQLKNVVIRNNSIAGILSRNYRISGVNTVISSGGEYLLAGLGGGAYNFDNCTFANNWRHATRQTPAVFLSNVLPISSTQAAVYEINPSKFRNCIIHGNGLNEIALDMDNQSVPVNLRFENCLLKAEEKEIEPILEYFFDSFVGHNPGFKNFGIGDFTLSEDAFVIGKGKSIPGLNTDILGHPYASPPAIGAFEYFEE